MKKKLMVKKIKWLLVMLMLPLWFVACGSQSLNNDQDQQTATTVPLMVLPPELSAVSASLTSTLTIYSSTVTQIYHKSLTFEEDDDGNDIVTSSALTLSRNTHYRFVIVFYWDSVVFSYVDTVIQIPDADESEISYESTDITYDTSDPNSSLGSPSLYYQDSKDLAITSMTVTPSGIEGYLSLDVDVESVNAETDVIATITDDGEIVKNVSLSRGQITDEGILPYGAFIAMEDLEEKAYLLTITAENEDGEQTTLTTTLDIHK